MSHIEIVNDPFENVHIWQNELKKMTIQETSMILYYNYNRLDSIYFSFILKVISNHTNYLTKKLNVIYRNGTKLIFKNKLSDLDKKILIQTFGHFEKLY